MKSINSPWYQTSKLVILIAGLPFSLIGIIGLSIYKNNAWIINGLLWMTIGILLLLKGKLVDKKLKKLKVDGICYNAKIVNILPYNFVKIGSYITAIAECIYIDREGSKCFIKSGCLLFTGLDRKEDLSAKVYVSRNNSRKYVIEIFKKSSEEPRFDVDYR